MATPTSIGIVTAVYVVSNTFSDPDQSNVLSYTATLSDGTALPSWLTFTPATRTFSGTPREADAGIIDIAVTAGDSANASASDIFRLNVAAPNGPGYTAQHEYAWGSDWQVAG